MMPWSDFARFKSPYSFYGCVNADGYWFESSLDFATAIHWCCCQCGEFNLTPEEEVQWMANQGVQRGISIIHSNTLKKMYEAGLIN